MGSAPGGAPRRILGIVSHPLPLIGGAQIAMATLLRQLRDVRAHTVALFGIGALEDEHRDAGLRIQMMPDAEALTSAVRRWRPDLMLSSLEDALAAARIAERFTVPHVVWIQSFEFTPPRRTEIDAWGVDPDRRYPSVAERRMVLESADALLANSRFMQRRLRRCGARAAVLYPSFDDRALRVRPPSTEPASRVTCVAGYRYKGIDIVLDLARSMPAVEFRIAGRIVEPWREAALRLANVTLAPFSAPSEYLRDGGIVIVPSRWPEPFGRVAVEAAANGIPVLASRTGGLEEICGASTVRQFRSVTAWRRALDTLLADPRVAHNQGVAARRRAARFLGDRSARQLADLVDRLTGSRAVNWSRRPRVVIAGPRTARTAFAMVNAEWTTPGGSRHPVESRPLADTTLVDADVSIQHDWLRPFEEWPLPPTGHAAAVRTWDFGPFPRAWVDRVNTMYDELWVWTNWIREQAIAGGIAPARVAVVPLGVDPRRFHPVGPRARLPTRKRFVFLFLGAPILRKGFDILLAAYRAAFARPDDVSLVVKANPADVFYDGTDLRDAIADMQRDPTAPEIVLIDRFMPADALASLYRAAHVTVLPYRAEGFGLPILESMACGRPVMVPNFGAALDFCTTDASFLVPVRRIRAPVGRRMAFNSLGFEQDVDAVDFCEIETDVLAAHLREAAWASADVLRAKGAASRARALTFSWDASRRALAEAVARLRRQPVPRRFQVARDKARQHARHLRAARDIYFGGTG